MYYIIVCDIVYIDNIINDTIYNTEPRTNNKRDNKITEVINY